MIWRHHFSISYNAIARMHEPAGNAAGLCVPGSHIAVVCVIIRSCDDGTKDKQAIYQSKKARWCLGLGSTIGTSRERLRRSKHSYSFFEPSWIATCQMHSFLFRITLPIPHHSTFRTLHVHREREMSKSSFICVLATAAAMLAATTQAFVLPTR